MSNLEGVVSCGIKLSYKKTGATFTELEGLQEVPELGAEKEKIEITTLKDTAKRYTNGIKDYGDLAYKFLYDNSSETSNYRVLKGFDDNNTVVDFKVEYPDHTAHEFKAQVAVKLDGVGVNGVLAFTATLSLQSDLTTSNPGVEAVNINTNKKGEK